MRTTTFLTATFLIILLSIVAFGQKRPTTPATKTPPVAPTPTSVSPAENFFNQGLKCPKDDYDCQISNYTKAINLKLDTKEVFKNRGMAYWSKQEYEKAITDLSKAITLDPNDVRDYNARGVAYMGIAKKGPANDAYFANLAKAVKDFDTALDLEPANIDALGNRSLANIRLWKDQEALKDIDKALSLSPNDVWLLGTRSVLFERQRDWAKAIEVMNKIIIIEPNETEHYDNRASFYGALNKYEQAIQDSTKAISLKPNEARYYERRSLFYFQQEKFDLAIKDAERYISLKPNVTAVDFDGIATIYLKVKNHTKAIEMLTRAISLDVTDKLDRWRYYWRRADVYKELGDCDTAIADYKKAMADSYLEKSVFTKEIQECEQLKANQPKKKN